MATPKTKGVLVKPRRAWGLSSAAGATAILVGVTGKFCHGQLLNDSSPGIDIAIYGLSTWQGSASTGVIVTSYFGALPGATFVSAGNPLTAGSPIFPGSLYSLIDANQYGTEQFWTGGDGGWFFHLDDTPLLILPPGYSAVLTPGVVGGTALYSFMWGPA